MDKPSGNDVFKVNIKCVTLEVKENKIHILTKPVTNNLPTNSYFFIIRLCTPFCLSFSGVSSSQRTEIINWRQLNLTRLNST